MVRVDRPALGVSRDGSLAPQIFQGRGILGLILDYRRHRSLRDHLAAVDARARPDVHQVVRGANGLLVVLHHNDGIAEIPQFVQGLDEFSVVPLMEADSGFIQNIQRPHQPRTDLGSEPDALGFPAGKRARFAVQGEIFESDVRHEFQPVADLAQGDLRDLFEAASFELQFPKKIVRVLNGERGQGGDVLAVNEHRERLFAQALALALRADLLRPYLLRAQTVAERTGPVRAVEGEQARFYLRERESVHGAGEFRGQGHFPALLGEARPFRGGWSAETYGYPRPVRFLCGFHRFRQTQAIVLLLEIQTVRNAVHDEFDGVLLVPGKLDALTEIVEFPVHPHFPESRI